MTFLKTKTMNLILAYYFSIESLSLSILESISDEFELAKFIIPNTLQTICEDDSFLSLFCEIVKSKLFASLIINTYH